MCSKMATQGSGESPPEGLPSSGVVGDGAWIDEMDDTLVGPVYLRLDDPTFRPYYNATYEMEEEVGDEEIGLDLSAPPPES